MQNLLSFISEEATTVVRDALWKDIRLSPAMDALYHTRALRKLSRIRQLGPVSLIYPTAVHTRLDHSLGVYHLSREIILSLLRRGSKDFTEEGIHSFLAAALLHDIGHFPYAHSLKELPLRGHESLAAQMIESDGELRDAIALSLCDPSSVADIIDDTRKTDEREILLYRSLLSGTLDPDKLDYLNRDAFFCGVPYGSQDASYITGHLVLREERIALEEEALASIEHLLFAKYLMYRNVYWHRGTRAATAMIKEAVLTALEEKLIRKEELYGRDDATLFSLFSSLECPVSSLVSSVRDGKLYRTSYEADWDERRPLDRCASTLDGRLEAERKLEAKLGMKAHEIIIDIPEPITFESSMPILRADGRLSTFDREDQLFTSDIASVFSRCLRKIRVFTLHDCDGNKLRDAILSF